MIKSSVEEREAQVKRWPKLGKSIVTGAIYLVLKDKAICLHGVGEDGGSLVGIEIDLKLVDLVDYDGEVTLCNE